MASSLLARPILVLIRGAGDLATGVAVRLHRAGLTVVMTELPQPLVVRRTVAFAEAVYTGETTVEGVTARNVHPSSVRATVARGEIPVVVDPEGALLTGLQPDVVVDARMAKRNLGTSRDDAMLVVGLGPGFTAEVDCHAVVETNRGHRLGRVIWEGSAEPDTGVPGRLGGADVDRVLRAPVAGVVEPQRAIGERVRVGDVVATVGGQAVRAALDGVLRGMLYPGLTVDEGEKVGDIDPRADVAHILTISDKSLAVGGGVLEAVLSAPQLR